MNQNTGIIIGVIVLILIGGGVYASMNPGAANNDTNTDAMMVKSEMENKAIVEQKTMSENESMSNDEDQMMAKEDSMTKGGVMVKAGSYEVYSPEKIARASSGEVVLFFNANWCPTCRAIDADIKANIAKIPSELSILSVDYDNSSELKKKYGVTYQHTFVQVDKDGNLIKKWSGSPTLAALVLEVK